MVRKILIILLLISLLIIPTIIADNSVIKVKTKPYHRLLVTVYKAGITPSERITSFSPYKDTKASGELTFNLTTSEKKVDIKLDLKKDDMNVVTHDFYDVETKGELIFINLFPLDNMTFTIGNPVINTTPNTADDSSNLTNVTNITVENVSATSEPNITITENKTSSNFSIISSKFYEKNSKTLFYVLIVTGVIVGIAIIAFIIRKILKKTHYPAPSPIHRRSRDDSSDRFLAEAEKKLKIAQEEIEKIKSRNQELREAERKLEEDRLRVERLKRGY